MENNIYFVTILAQNSFVCISWAPWSPGHRSHVWNVSQRPPLWHVIVRIRPLFWMSLYCSSSLTCEHILSHLVLSFSFQHIQQSLFCHHVLLGPSELFLSVHWTDEPMHVVRSWNNILSLVVINKPEALKTVMCLIFYSCNLKRGFVWSRPMYGLVDRLKKPDTQYYANVTYFASG